MEDIVASIKAGYECGKKHNIIVLAEGVMSADEFGKKLKEAGTSVPTSSRGRGSAVICSEARGFSLAAHDEMRTTEESPTARWKKD